MMWVKQQSNCLCREILLSNMHWFADFFNFERLVTLRRKLASGHSLIFFSYPQIAVNSYLVIPKKGDTVRKYICARDLRAIMSEKRNFSWITRVR